MEIFTRGSKQTEKEIKIAGETKKKSFTDNKNVLLFNYVRDIKKNSRATDQAILTMGYEDPEFPGCGLYLDEGVAYIKNQPPFQGKAGTPYADRAFKMSWIKDRPALIKAMKRTDNETGEVSYYGNDITPARKIIQYMDSLDGEGCYAAIGNWFPSRQEGKDNVLCAYMQGYDSEAIDPATGKGTNYDYIFEVTFEDGIPDDYLPKAGEKSVLAAVVVPHSAYKAEYEGAKISGVSADRVSGFYPIPKILKPKEEAAAAAAPEA